MFVPPQVPAYHCQFNASFKLPAEIESVTVVPLQIVVEVLAAKTGIEGRLQ